MTRSHMFIAGVVATAPFAAAADTLEDAVIAAYATNPSLAEARLAVRSAREDGVQVRAAYWPRVDFTADYAARRLEAEERGIFGPLRRTEDLSGRNLSVRGVSELYTGGRREAQRDAALASVTGAQESLRGTEQQVILRTVTVYANVLRDEEVLQIRRDFSAALEQDLYGAQRRLQFGDVTRTDVDQSQARLARARAGEALAESDLQAALANYEAIVGATPEVLAPPSPPPGVTVTLDEAIEVARRIHPQLQQSRQEEAAARARVGIERSELEPQFGLVGNLNFAEDQNQEGDFAQSAAIAARIAVPLFEGGFARSRIRQSRIDVARAEQRTQARERALVAQVVAAWHSLDAARGVAAAARLQVEADESALNGVRREQGIGLRSTLDVLNAQQELLESRLSLVRAERDAFVGVFELLAAMGALDLEAVGLERDSGR